MSPKEGTKDATLPKSRTTPKGNQKKERPIQPLRAGKSWQDTSHKWGTVHISVWPHFGAPNLTAGPPAQVRTDNLYAPAGRNAAQVLRTQNKTNRKVVTVHRRERIVSQWVPESKSRIHSLKNYMCFSPAKLNLERVGQHKILPSSLVQALEEDLAEQGKNSYPWLASACFPRIPSVGSGTSGGVSAGTFWVARNYRGGK